MGTSFVTPSLSLHCKGFGVCLTRRRINTAVSIRLIIRAALPSCENGFLMKIWCNEDILVATMSCLYNFRSFFPLPSPLLVIFCIVNF